MSETTPRTIPFYSIIEGTRARKDYGDLKGLMESLKTLGSIHPIVLSQTEAGYILIAGGRRYRAMKELGVIELHHGSILTPGCLGFLDKSEVPEHELREAELDENLHRLKPNWIEDVLLVDEVHRLKRLEFGSNKWGVRQTAELLGPSFGRSNINYAVRVAKLLRADDKEILACDCMQDAISLMIKRQEDKALEELQRRVALQPPPIVPLLVGSSTSTSSFLDSFSVSTLPPVRPIQQEVKPSVSGQDAPIESSPFVTIPLSSMLICGDAIGTDHPNSRVLSRFPDASFDHIVTDIPYGIDMTNLNESMVTDVRDTHDVDQNVSMMPEFLKQAFRLVKPGGFCVFFYDLDHHEKLQLFASLAGWKVQSWPYIAVKTSPAQNNAAQYNTTKNYEVAMFLRKDGHTVLRKSVSSSWNAYDFSAERKLYNNPFAKPFTLWKDIYSFIAFPGQTVLDPYCGEMSACRAAINCGLVPYGVEISEQHYNRGLEHVRAAYALIHKSNVVFA